MRHLGDAASALVDGQLDHAARDRALSHLARCAPCRAEVEAQRRIKSGLSAAPTPALPLDLTQRLLALADPGEPLPPRTPTMPGSTGPPALPRPGYAEPRRSRGRMVRSAPPTRRRVRRRVLLATSALGFSGVALGGTFFLGAPNDGGPAVRVPIDRLTADHASTQARLPLRDPAFSAVQLSSGVGTGRTRGLPVSGDRTPLGPPGAGTVVRR
jgi:anti-sigma factor RsiW